MAVLPSIVRRGIGAPPWPREHGAWAMLVLPILLGFAVAARVAAGAAWIALAFLLLFLARAAAVPTLAKRREGRPLPDGLLTRRLAWGVLYGGAGVACLAAAFFGASPAGRAAVAAALLPAVALGLLHAVLGVFGRDRSLWGEIVGMAGLASAAPPVAAGAGAPFTPAAWGAAALALAYFLSSLAFVRAYRKRKTAGRIDARSCAWAHAAIVASLAGLWAAGGLPAAALGSFVPVLGRTVWGLLHPPRDLAVLGWREVGVAATFTLAAVAAFAVGPR